MVVAVEPHAQRVEVRQHGLPWDRGLPVGVDANNDDLGVVLRRGRGEDLIGAAVDDGPDGILGEQDARRKLWRWKRHTGGVHSDGVVVVMVVVVVVC